MYYYYTVTLLLCFYVLLLRSCSSTLFLCITITDCEELVTRLDPNCELVDLETQVNSAKKAESALTAIQWEEIFKQRKDITSLINHPLLQVCFLSTSPSPYCCCKDIPSGDLILIIL